jgi:hypothetical protein
VGEKFGYTSPEPNLRDFAVALFNSVSSIGPSGELLPHARVFLSIWKDSLSSRPAFEQWSDHLAGVLRVEDQLNDAPDNYDPDDDDSYELIERFVLSRLLQRFQGDASDAELLDDDPQPQQLLLVREASARLPRPGAGDHLPRPAGEG